MPPLVVADEQIHDVGAKGVRHRFSFRDPIVQIRVAHLQQSFESIELIRREAIDIGIGESPEQEIGFPRPSMPAPKPQAFAADIRRVVGHRDSFRDAARYSDVDWVYTAIFSERVPVRPSVLFPIFASVTELPGIGPRIGKLLSRLCGERIVDLLWHLPVSVVDRRLLPNIAAVEPGQVATLRVIVDRHEAPPSRKRPYTIRCFDASGMLHLVYFNTKGDYLEKLLPPGETRIVSGKVEVFNNQRQMTHPDFAVPGAELNAVVGFQPVYGLTAGLTPRVLAKALREALARAPDLTEGDKADWIDPSLRKRDGLPPWRTALLSAHSPNSATDLSPNAPARRRLAYDELLANQLALSIVRTVRRRSAGRSLKGTGAIWRAVSAALPFTPTGSQSLAIAEIAADMESTDRMLRLLQGDVGSGKTLVALGALCVAAEAGVQSALMAPTELLARQHFRTLSSMGAKAGLRIAVLTGRTKGRDRDSMLSALVEGRIDVLVGTHALIQDDVVFRDLGLVIIDEQHRFGVEQRVKLLDKGRGVDLLVMTATPIPRTLQMTAYGDLDVSKLTEKPANRRPVDTRVLPMDRVDEVVAGVQRTVASGHKVYWVCPLVEDSEDSELSAAEERYRHLLAIFGDRVGLVHGRMKGDERDAVMSAFAGRDDPDDPLERGSSPKTVDVLVATTVIEVGVDVPEATVMIVEHAETFGLAQLHQLRGRVGRGSAKSSCVLLYGTPLSETGRARLNILRESDDGFRIAEEDLRLRGGGEVLGTRQSGLPALRIARLEEHADVLDIARKDAAVLLAQDPSLETPRGRAARVLLYLFERDGAIRMLKSG